MTPEQRHHAAVIGRDGGCVLRHLLDDHECEGSLQAMHVPPKSSTKAFRAKAVSRQRIGEQLPPELALLASLTEDELVADPDLGLAGCSRGHYRWDKRGVRCSRDRLPAHVERRCAELAMTRLLDELLGPLPGEPDLRPIPLRPSTY